MLSFVHVLPGKSDFVFVKQYRMTFRSHDISHREITTKNFYWFHDFCHVYGIKQYIHKNRIIRRGLGLHVEQNVYFGRIGTDFNIAAIYAFISLVKIPIYQVILNTYSTRGGLYEDMS